jgi:hypothetical protein
MSFPPAPITYDVTDDIGVYVNTDVRYLVIGGVLQDSQDDAAFDAAYDLDQALDAAYARGDV